MSDDVSISDIHGWLEAMLTAVVSILEDEELPYWLAYGTALGAARNGALIPWDTDVDLLVPVGAYPSVVKALRGRLPNELELLTPTRNEDYEYAFARVHHRSIDHKYVSIDLFPLAAAPQAMVLRRVYTLASRAFTSVLFLQRADIDSKRHWSSSKRTLAGALQRILRSVPSAWPIACVRSLERSVRDTGALWNSCGSYGAREFYPSAWFTGDRFITLLDRQMRVPAALESYLAQTYGADFATPIPEAAQVAQLEFVERFVLDPVRRQLDGR